MIISTFITCFTSGLALCLRSLGVNIYVCIRYGLNTLLYNYRDNVLYLAIIDLSLLSHSTRLYWIVLQVANIMFLSYNASMRTYSVL